MGKVQLRRSSVLAKGAPGRGTLEKEKPPILGLIQRGGQVVLHMLPNVQQKTIKPIIEAAVTKGSLLYTDESLLPGLSRTNCPEVTILSWFSTIFPGVDLNSTSPARAAFRVDQARYHR